MMTLTVICALAAGATWTVPDGWSLVQVQNFHPAQSNICYSIDNGCERAAKDAERPTRITLTRPVEPGAVVTLPAGCSDVSAKDERR